MLHRLVTSFNNDLVFILGRVNVPLIQLICLFIASQFGLFGAFNLNVIELHWFTIFGFCSYLFS